ncbi:hypothetical protein [Thiomonas sp. FB-Cd]|uniref:hypothetical protein n=1 Tax=Thiomonas sp. FB-Cd TaxID=1158292 RepID=UPI001E5CF6F6|nr:hypothetical protein [Thiomonas sp. FB-Cd]
MSESISNGLVLPPAIEECLAYPPLFFASGSLHLKTSFELLLSPVGLFAIALLALTMETLRRAQSWWLRIFAASLTVAFFAVSTPLGANLMLGALESHARLEESHCAPPRREASSSFLRAAFGVIPIAWTISRHSRKQACIGSFRPCVWPIRLRIAPY